MYNWMKREYLCMAWRSWRRINSLTMIGTLNQQQLSILCLVRVTIPSLLPILLDEGIMSVKLNRLLTFPLLPTLLKPLSPYDIPLPEISGLMRPESIANSIDLHARSKGVETFLPVSDEVSRNRMSV